MLPTLYKIVFFLSLIFRVFALTVNKCCPDGKVLDLHKKDCVGTSFALTRYHYDYTSSFGRFTTGPVSKSPSETDKNITESIKAAISDFDSITETNITLANSSQPFSKCELSQRRNIKDFILVPINGTVYAYKVRGGEIFKTFCMDRNNIDQDDTAVIQVCDESTGQLCLSFCCGKESYTSDDTCTKGSTSSWDDGIQRNKHKRVHSDLHCEKPIKYSKNLYEINNNQLVVDNTVRDHSEYCITNAVENGKPVSNVLLCPIVGHTDGRNTLKTVLLINSEICLLIVLCFHYLIPGLRKSQFAKMKMAFLSSLCVLYFILIITTTVDFKEKVGDGACIFMGLLIQYIGLVTFLCLTCMTVQIWLSFRTINDPTDNIQENQRIFAIITKAFFLLIFLGPLIITMLTAILQIVESPASATYVHPRIGLPSCFLKDEEPAFYNFFLIIAILFSVIFILCTLIVLAYIKEVHSNDRNSNIKRDDMKICIQFVMIMGINFVSEFITFMVGWKAKEYWDHPLIWVCDILNWLTGVFILLVFVTKSTNRKLMKDYCGPCLARNETKILIIVIVVIFNLFTIFITYNEYTDGDPLSQIKTFLLILSEISIFIVLLSHCLISELRRFNFAKLKMAFLSSLFITFLILILTTIIDFKKMSNIACIVMGLLLQYFGLATFFWLTCMSFDIWLTFRKIDDPTDNIEKKKRIRSILNKTFFLISFLGPLMITLLTACLQTLKSPANASYIHPRIDSEHCFLNHAESAFYYFFLAISILLSVNIILYALLVYAFFWGVWSNNRNSNTSHNMKICLELIMIMGLNWVTELISFVVGWGAGDHALIWICNILNWLTGVFIFLAFVTKSSNRKLLQDYFGQRARSDMDIPQLQD